MIFGKHRVGVGGAIAKRIAAGETPYRVPRDLSIDRLRRSRAILDFIAARSASSARNCGSCIRRGWRNNSRRSILTRRRVGSRGKIGEVARARPTTSRRETTGLLRTLLKFRHSQTPRAAYRPKCTFEI